MSVYDVQHCPHCGSTDIHSGEEDAWTCYACQHHWGGEAFVIDRLKAALLAAQKLALLRRQQVDEAQAAAKASSKAMSEAQEREDRAAEKYADVERALFASETRCRELRQQYADVERAVFSGETDRCDHETLCREIRRLAQEVPGVGVEPFPRQPRNNGGWTIHHEYLLAIARNIDAKAATGDAECPVLPRLELEDIEAVLLAIEEIGNIRTESYRRSMLGK